jgi:hypothetical protein
MKEIEIYRMHINISLIRDNRSNGKNNLPYEMKEENLSVFAKLTIQQVTSPRRGYQWRLSND